jgi:acetyl esterase/lipase
MTLPCLRQAHPWLDFAGLILAGLVFSGLLAPQRASAAAYPVPAGVAHHVETYKKIGAVTLKIDIFEPAAKIAGRQDPAIVFFHGGGWVDGKTSQLFPQCQYLASRGMIAFSAEYRTQKEHGTTPAECVKDARSAMRWVRANAARLGVDPRRIAAGGSSAGGHMAAALATTTAFDEDGQTTVSCLPNALVLFNPVFDNGPTGYGYERVKGIFPQISPLHNLKPGLPPTVVFFGTKDQHVPVATSEKYRDTMRKFGNRCELFLYEGQPHTFYGYGNAHHKYFYLTLNEMDKFLASLGYLQGSPRVTPAQMAGKAE